MAHRVLLVLTLLAGCSDDDPERPPDAGSDAFMGDGGGSDGGPDAGPPGPVAVSIDTPAEGARVLQGEAVELSATCTGPEGATLSHEWTMPGGTPANASVEDPGTVTFETLGNVTLTYTCTTDDDESATTSVDIVVARDRWLPAVVGGLNLLPDGSDEVVLFDPAAVSPTEETLFAGMPSAIDEAARIRAALDATTLSPDGRYLTYMASPGGDTVDAVDLFLVDLEAEVPTATNVSMLPFGESVWSFSWSPDAQHIAVQRGAGGSRYLDILTLDDAGSVSTMRAFGEGDGSGDGVGLAAGSGWSPDSELYFVPAEIGGSAREAFVFDLSDPSAGLSRVHPSFDGAGGRSVMRIYALGNGRALIAGTLLPNGGRDIAIVDRTIPDDDPHLLTAPALTDRGVGVGTLLNSAIALSPDRTKVLFWTHPTMDQEAAYVADLNAAEPIAVQVGEPVPIADSITDLAWSADSSHYSYDDGALRVGAANSADPATVGDPVMGLRALDARWAPTGAGLVVRGDLRDDGQMEAFRIDVSDGSAAVLHEELSTSVAFVVWIDGARVAYGVNLLEGARIFASEVASAASSVDLAGPLPAGVYFYGRVTRRLPRGRLALGAFDDELALLLDIGTPGTAQILQEAGGSDMVRHFPSP